MLHTDTHSYTQAHEWNDNSIYKNILSFLHTFNNKSNGKDKTIPNINTCSVIKIPHLKRLI